MKTWLGQVLAGGVAVAVGLGLRGGRTATAAPAALVARMPSTQPVVLSGHLKLGGRNPGGVETNATRRYLGAGRQALAAGDGRVSFLALRKRPVGRRTDQDEGYGQAVEIRRERRSRARGGHAGDRRMRGGFEGGMTGC